MARLIDSFSRPQGGGFDMRWLVGFSVGVFLLLLAKLPFPQFFAYPFAPQLGFFVVLCWGLSEEEVSTASLSVFLLGLLEDVLAGTPLGLWAFGFCLFYAGVLQLSSFLLGAPRVAAIVFAMMSLLVMLSLWFIVGLKDNNFLVLGGVLLSWLSTCVLLPAFIVLLRPVQERVNLGLPVLTKW